MPLNLELLQKYSSIYTNQQMPVIEVLATVDSTNDYLKRSLSAHSSNFPRACLAEQQTNARTSKPGKIWHSPAGKNIALSCGFSFHQPAVALAGLSLVVGLAVIQALRQYTAIIGLPAAKLPTNLQIKWPNDVYWQGKKLAGILTEIEIENPQLTHAIIGVGLNVNLANIPPTQINQPWTSWYLIFDQEGDRNKIAALLIAQIFNDLAIFQQHGLSYFLAAWEHYDYLKGKYLTVQNQQGLHSGIAAGIDKHGRLVLQDKTGRLLTYTSGDILKGD